MGDLGEREQQLRLYIETIEEQIKRFEGVKKKLQEREDEIREEITRHSLSPTPINLKPEPKYKGDVYSEIQQHLLELNKLKNYISMKLKEVIQEEELLESLKSRFGESIGFEKPKRGEFEIVFTDEEVKEASEQLNASREKIRLIKDSLEEGQEIKPIKEKEIAEEPEEKGELVEEEKETAEQTEKETKEEGGD